MQSSSELLEKGTKENSCIPKLRDIYCFASAAEEKYNIPTTYGLVCVFSSLPFWPVFVAPPIKLCRIFRKHNCQVRKRVFGVLWPVVFKLYFRYTSSPRDLFFFPFLFENIF